MRIDCMFFCLAAFLSFRRSRALCTMTILQQGCDCVLSDIGRQIELSRPAFRCAKHSSENDVLRLRNRRNQWLAELVRAGHTLSTTTLNIAEIYAGMRPAEGARTEALLSGLELHELTGSSAVAHCSRITAKTFQC
jgi:hypothetical protein